MRYRDRFIVDMKEIKRPPYIGKRVSICIERGCKLILTGGGIYLMTAKLPLWMVHMP